MLGLALHQMQPIHVAILEVSLQFGSTLKRLFQRFPRQTVKVNSFDASNLELKWWFPNVKGYPATPNHLQLNHTILVLKSNIVGYPISGNPPCDLLSPAATQNTKLILSSRAHLLHNLSQRETQLTFFRERL